MTDSTTLAPCPHCGEPASGYAIEAHEHAMVFAGQKMQAHHGSYVIEGECACGSGMIGATQAEVTERWNRRAPAQESSESEPLITIESSLRFRLACAKDDVEQLEIENRELRESVAKLKAAPASQPVAVPAGVELFGYFHELLDHDGKGTGVWVGTKSRSDVERSYIAGEVGKEIVAAHTAAQVQAMLARGLAPGWQAVPVEPTEAMERAMAAQFCGTVDEVRRAWAEGIAAAPGGPAREPLSPEQIMDALPGGVLDCLNDPWDEGKGDRDTMHSIRTDVLRVARAIEAAHGITAAQKGGKHAE